MGGQLGSISSNPEMALRPVFQSCIGKLYIRK